MSDEYQSAVLADSPLAYWRLDEVGAATSGQTIPDLSGDARDAKLCYGNTAGDLVPFGHASAVETDPDSRALHLFSDASFSFGHNYSYVHRGDDAALSVTGDFTLEAWIKCLPFSFGGLAPVFQKREQYQLQLYPTQAAPGDFAGRFSLRVWLSDGSAHDLTAGSFPIFSGTWYHVIGGRSGNALFLRINYHHLVTLTIPGLANAPSEPAHTLPFIPCSVKANSMVVGSLPFYDGELNVEVDECAFYDYALGADRALAHHEAALNSLDMAGRCDIRLTATLNGDAAPDPEISSYRHNWDSPAVERFNHLTTVFKSKDRTHAATGVSAQRPPPGS